MPLRLALICLVVGCADPPLPERPLPPLVDPSTANAGTLTASRQFRDGELMVWQVAIGTGTRVGRVRLEARRQPGGDVRVESRFHAEGVAARLRPAGFRLDSRVSAAPAPPLDLHGVLGAVRAWAPRARTPARTQVAHGDVRYQLELAAPVIEEAQIRIDARARAPGEPDIDLRLWLSTDGRALPLALEAVQSGTRLVATLVDYAAP